MNGVSMQDFRNMKKDMIAGIQAAAAADNLIVCSGTPLQAGLGV